MADRDLSTYRIMASYVSKCVNSDWRDFFMLACVQICELLSLHCLSFPSVHLLSYFTCIHIQHSSIHGEYCLLQCLK